jgi:hypothetical protein
MSKPIAYKTGTIQPPNTAKQNNVLVGVGGSNWGAGVANANFYNSLDSSYQYVIVKNSAVPAMWGTGDFTTGSLLTTINGLPDRVGQTRFTNANTAISWSLASGEYTILKNELPYGGPITNGLVLDFNPKVNNYFANGDFAYGTTIGWVEYGGSPFIYDITNDKPYVGSKSTKALGNIGGGFTWGRYTNPIYGPAGLLVVGNTYTFSFWAKIISGPNFTISWNNQNGSGETNAWTSGANITNTWTKVTQTFTYNAARLYFYIAGNYTGTTQYIITEMQLEDGPTANAFSSFPVTAAGLTIPNNGLLNSSSFSLTNGPYLNAVNNGNINLDGVDDYIILTDASLKNYTTITANIWMYVNSTNNWETYFSYNAEEAGLLQGWGVRRQSNLNNYQYWGGSGNSGIKLYKNGTLISSGSASSIVSDGTNITGSWTMITLVATGVSSWNTHNRLTLGTRSDSINSATNMNIGSFNLYNRELSAAEIENLYEANASIYFPTSSIVNQGLTVYYDFSNPNCYAGSGTTIYDLSGYNNNGTLINGTSYSTTNGGALIFDGVDDYVQFTSTYAGTICFWGIADVGATDGLQALVGVTSTGDGALRFLGGTFRGNATGAEAGTADNNDYQFGYVNQFMINGVSSLPKTYQGFYVVPNSRTLTQNFYVGAIGNRNVSTLSHTFMGRVYKGKIFKVMIYNRQLTNAELLQNYNAFKAQYGL